MNVKGNAENPLPDLALLQTEIERSNGGTIAVKALLEIYNAPIDVNGGVVEIAIAEATLSLEATGLAVIPQTRYGRRRRPAALEITKSSENSSSSGRKNETKTKSSANAAAGPDGARIAGAADVERSASASDEVGNKHNISVKDEQPLVSAIGNNNWSLKEDDAPLSGVYLDNVPLCELAEIQRSNRHSLTVALWVNANQIQFKFIPKARSPTLMDRLSRLEKNNIAQIKKLVITSALHNSASNQRYAGKLTLARSIHDDHED